MAYYEGGLYRGCSVDLLSQLIIQEGFPAIALVLYPQGLGAPFGLGVIQASKHHGHFLIVPRAFRGRYWNSKKLP